MRRLASLILIVLAVWLLVASQDREDHLTLLTYAEESATGGTADVSLRITPGEGAIYMDSFPLTRIDTQSSTRYANRIACDLVGADCSRYDFYYTIRAQSSIVGGPSAGAAIAVLTAAVLEGDDLDQGVALTGTINSGGIIGPVAGIPEKIDGARAAGITTVLVPSLIPENATGNLSSEMRVLRVGTIEEALAIYTGTTHTRDGTIHEAPFEYNARMEMVSREICARNDKLAAEVARRGLSYADTANYSGRIAAAGDAYSSASLCFSANIDLQEIILNDSSSDERKKAYAQTGERIRALEKEMRAQEPQTINDLEVYVIVMERVLEAKELLQDVNLSDPDPRSVAYAHERALSAETWTAFSGMPSAQVTLDERRLHDACLDKISEADERINYVRIYLPQLVDQAQETLQQAYREEKRDPVLCIFSASKAKAQANILASIVSIGEESVPLLLQEKLDAASMVIWEQEHFPLLGASYRAYAANLAVDAPYSALTFAEYALELSDLGMYFPPDRGPALPAPVVRELPVFLAGLLVGIAAFLSRRPRRPVRRERRTEPSREKR